MKKPFDSRGLLLRAGKLISKEVRRNNRYVFEGIGIDDDSRRVTENGDEVEVIKKEYDLLHLLIKNRGVVLFREKIINEVWNIKYYPGDRSGDIYISRLREKFKTISVNIHTVKRIGYKLN